MDAPTAWNLRCNVREKLIESIQKNYLHGLPKVKIENMDYSKEGLKFRTFV